MWVERIEYTDPVLAEARQRSVNAVDGCVSASEIALGLEMEPSGVLLALAKLEELDWVVRSAAAARSPAAVDTRWIVREHTTLTVGRRYEVLEICSDNLRVLDDRDDPVLFNASCFRVVDEARPPFWSCEVGAEGELYCGPRQWKRPGFFEAYHDGIASIRDEFWRDLSELHPTSWQERRGAR